MTSSKLRTGTMEAMEAMKAMEATMEKMETTKIRNKLRKDTAGDWRCLKTNRWLFF